MIEQVAAHLVCTDSPLTGIVKVDEVTESCLLHQRKIRKGQRIKTYLGLFYNSEVRIGGGSPKEEKQPHITSEGNKRNA